MPCQLVAEAHIFVVVAVGIVLCHFINFHVYEFCICYERISSFRQKLSTDMLICCQFCGEIQLWLATCLTPSSCELLC